MRWLALAALAACRPSAAITSDGDAPPGAVATAASTSPEAGSTPHLVLLPARSDVDALTLIRTERLRARSEGRVLAVYVGAAWCEPCRRFHEEVASGRLDGHLGATTLLTFDADADLDRLGAAGYRFTFVPFVALPGADGRPTESQDARGKGSGAWQEIVPKLAAWQRAALTSR